MEMTKEGKSFNPCFCGTGARTSNYLGYRCWETRFNPCFCGTGARTEDDEEEE